MGLFLVNRNKYFSENVQRQKICFFQINTNTPVFETGEFVI